jgi:hypothetical protein
MKTRSWLCLAALSVAAAVAGVPEPTLTFAAAKKSTLNEAKQKCAENAKSAAPGVGHLSVEARKTVYDRCMRRAGFYNER